MNIPTGRAVAFSPYECIRWSSAFIAVDFEVIRYDTKIMKEFIHAYGRPKTYPVLPRDK